jgi:carbon storage regulator
MLVLSRKPSQSIMIGSDIKITIVKVERNQVRIGIEAPRDVTILRDELIETGHTDSNNASQPLEQFQVVTL